MNSSLEPFSNQKVIIYEECTTAVIHTNYALNQKCWDAEAKFMRSVYGYARNGIAHKNLL